MYTKLCRSRHLYATEKSLIAQRTHALIRAILMRKSNAVYPPSFDRELRCKLRPSLHNPTYQPASNLL